MIREYCGIIKADEIEINQKEIERRLGGCRDRGDAVFEECRKALLEAAVCRYALVKTEVVVTENTCCFDTFSIESRDLTKNLGGCDEAWLMGVTIGPGVDRLLARLAVKSPAKHFITDAYASALVEALADKAEELVKTAEKTNSGVSESRTRPRYSPGYGDCRIENQRGLLERLRAKKRLGISLDEACFMKPVKSITAIIGVRP